MYRNPFTTTTTRRISLYNGLFYYSIMKVEEVEPFVELMIATGIQEQRLPIDFKMGLAAKQILIESLVRLIEDKENDEIIIMNSLGFIKGYYHGLIDDPRLVLQED